MKIKLTVFLLLFITIPLACITAGVEEPGLAKNVKFILKDGTIVSGPVAGRTSSEVFVEQKNGKAVTVKIQDIRAAFNTDNGNEIIPGGSGSKKSDKPWYEKNIFGMAGGSGEDGTKDTASETKKTQAPDGAQGPKDYTEVYAYTTIMNSYSIGTPLQNWFGDDIQSGSPAFFNVGANMYTGLDAQGTLLLGIGLSLNIPPSHSIWGSNLGFGFRDELVLSPYILSLDLAVRYAVKELEGLSVTVSPSLLLSLLSGDLDWSGNISLSNGTLVGPATYNTNMGSIGMGFGISAGAEYYFGMFGLSLKLGYRILNSGLMFDSSLGSWSMVDPGGNAIGLDLGGLYGAVGILVKLGG